MRTKTQADTAGTRLADQTQTQAQAGTAGTAGSLLVAPYPGGLPTGRRGKGSFVAQDELEGSHLAISHIASFSYPFFPKYRLKLLIS